MVFLFAFIPRMFLSFVLFVAALNQHAGASSLISDADALKYPASFGYVDPALVDSPSSFVSDDSVRRATSDFQSIAGLNGILDEETPLQMGKRRCSVPDRNTRQSNSTRRKRNADIQGNRWNKKRLTYRISKYTSDLEKSVVDREIAKAFQLWAEVTQLTFTSVQTGKVDIDIRFESGKYAGNDKPFDGPKGILGRAFFPESGDIHFDEDETWTIDSTGTNLFQVATHEFGHAIGLNHSEVKTAVMNARHNGYDPDFKLHADDIEKIQKLYGKYIPDNWINKKINEHAAILEEMENELKETKQKLDKAMDTIEYLETKLNARTRDIMDTDGKMPSSCEDLKLMGQKINGIFLVKRSKNTDAVFCNFNPNRTNNKLEKWMGHADIKSNPVYFYVQRNSPYKEKEVAIPFDVARVNIGNAMDWWTSGIFTAPRSGTYFFSFTGLASFPETKSPNWVYLVVGLYLDGKHVGTAQTTESNSVANQFSSLSLQSTLHLERSNDVWLQIDDMSPGVSLHDGPTPGRNGHWTHFTGWMLEEEIETLVI